MDSKQVGLEIGSVFVLLLLQLIRPLLWFCHVPAPSFFGPFFDSELRRRFQPPDKLIERSRVRPGMSVLDLGCGSGAFVPYTARAVGYTGKVYALDIQQSMLDQLEHKLALPEYRDIRNVEIKPASAYQLPFPKESIDLVLMITVLQEIPDKKRALEEVRRVLRPEGVLAVTEMIPDPDYPPLSTTIKQAHGGGFELSGVYGNTWNYTARFRKHV